MDEMRLIMYFEFEFSRENAATVLNLLRKSLLLIVVSHDSRNLSLHLRTEYT